MTPDQMAELAARLRDFAKWDRVMRHNPQRATDCDAAAALIESMAQQSSRHVALVCPQCSWTLERREPLTNEQIDDIRFSIKADHHTEHARKLVRAVEQAHGIRQEDAA